jgi:hypothetical protein
LNNFHFCEIYGYNKSKVPDPGCFFGSRIQIFPSRIQVQKDPGSGSASKNLSKFSPKNCFKLWEKLSGRFIPDPDFFLIPDPDPGSRNKKSTGSRSAPPKKI